MLDRHLRISYVDWIFEELNYDLEAPLYFDASNPERHLSSAQIKSLISKIAGGLKHHGLKKGDSVCVMSFNDIYYTPLYLGIMASGGIFTGANPGYKVSEMVHHLHVCEAKFLITGLSSFKTAKKAAEEAGIPESNVFVFNTSHEDIPEHSKSFWDLTTHGEAAWETVSDAANVPCAYINSSGTSGLPKAVVVPHAYMTSQCALQTDRKLPYKVRRLICLPPFPGYVAPSQHGAPIKAGDAIYVMPRYDAGLFIEAVEKYQITETLSVPPMLLSLPLAPTFTHKAMASLRQVFCGGAHVGNGVQQQMYAALHPDARLNQIYGMTEAGWICGFHYPEKDMTGSVGRPFPGFEIKVVDDAGNTLPPNHTGEIYIKPPIPMLGYLNNPAATTAAFAPHGWIRSGDIGHIAASGKCHVTDRKKDVIKVRGWQVSPAELEAVLLAHHDIVDAAVVRAKAGAEEVPRAYVVRREGAGLEEGEVRRFMAERLARFKVAEEVVFVDAIPRNPTGKILRRLLEEEGAPEGCAGRAGAGLTEGSVGLQAVM